MQMKLTTNILSSSDSHSKLNIIRILISSIPTRSSNKLFIYPIKETFIKDVILKKNKVRMNFLEIEWLN